MKRINCIDEKYKRDDDDDDGDNDDDDDDDDDNIDDGVAGDKILYLTLRSPS